MSTKAEGFTLIEMIVALAILGAFLTLGFRLGSDVISGINRDRDEVAYVQLAESVWHELSIRGLRDVQALDLSLPAGVTIEIDAPGFDGWGLVDWIPPDTIEAIRLRLIRPNGSTFVLEGVMPVVVP